jgi:hypothetical protein
VVIKRFAETRAHNWVPRGVIHNGAIRKNIIKALELIADLLL